MSTCIFCQIMEGSIPSAKVYEDDYVYAFLDTSQVTPGHTLVIPKKHVPDIMAYDEELAGQVFARLPKISRAILNAFPDAKGINILNNNGEMAYQTVFHSHIHLIPRYSEDDGFSLKFVSQADNYSQEEFQNRAEQISKQLK
ncbi:HIT family protein [Hutsoniella sourekii]